MLAEITPDMLAKLTPEELAELDALLLSDPVLWRPLAGPQEMAYHSTADVIGYGGAAGGGKTDLAVGKALTQHRKVGIFRLNGTELTGVIDRVESLLGSRDGYNGKNNIWRVTRHDGVQVQLEFGSFPNPNDEKKYQGRPHDLLVFDEAANMRASAVRFLLGWLRTTEVGQRCQALMTFNPPTTAEGRWVVSYFAPWLDKTHPRPALPGELRWFATIDGADTEVDGPDLITHNGDLIKPTSRTFIPSRIADNPFLMGTGYMATLQALPEPLRSQMLNGDFTAGIEDDPWQVCPTKWVEAAMDRWELPHKLEPMDSMGVDVARGGKDKTIIARRHGMWFDVPLVYAGSTTPDGPAVAGLVVSAQRNRCPVHIDAIGVGASPYDFLMQSGVQAIGVNVSESATEMDKSGMLQFFNLRSQMWWKLREALDPANNTGICLPPDPILLSELCTPTWKLSGSTIKVASRDEIYEKLGRSVDYGSAYCLALMDSPNEFLIRATYNKRDRSRDYDPLKSF